MCSKSFETQEGREISRKEAGESRGFPILWMGIMKDVFQMEGKECKDQERLKMCRKSMPERGRCFSMGKANLSKPMAVDEERLESAARNSSGKKGEQRTNETPRGTWIGEVRSDSLWLYYA